jgi:hypothetical protein
VDLIVQEGPVPADVQEDELLEAKVFLFPEIDNDRNEGQKETITVNFATERHLAVVVSLPAKDGRSILVKGPFDTGSQLSFLKEAYVKRWIPELLMNLQPCPYRVRGAGGEVLRVLGQIDIECRVEGRPVQQVFVIASIAEDVLLGLDFIAKHKANWNWRINRVEFNATNREYKMSGKSDIAAESITCARVAVEELRPDQLVYVPAQSLENGLEVLAGVSEVEQGQVNVQVANHSGLPLEIDAKELELEVLDEDEWVRYELDWTVEEQHCHMVGADPEEDKTPLPLPTELQAMVDRIKPPLAPKDRIAMEQLLRENRDIFVLDGEPLGRTGWVKHAIRLKDGTPIKQAPRRVPIHREHVVDEEMAKMKKAGAIRPSSSPWASPIVLVRKKDGSVRFCVDYRKLNEVTIKDAYPLPRIEESLEALQGARYFTTLDLKSGYWQVEMQEDHKFLTAFTTKHGLWEWNVMPFGLTNAPATFQRLMEKVLEGLQWKILALYLDDIIVFAPTQEEHLKRLSTVLDRCRKAGLKLKPTKCDLMRDSVEFLGHIVDAGGIRTDPAKVKQVRDWTIPKNVTEVRSFLGMTSYYRRFIKDYAAKAKPLHELTKKDVTFRWTVECQEAFETLKEHLIGADVLTLPDPKNPEYILDTDASNYAIGAVLSQVQHGREKVIAYGSRCLDQAEKNYCVTRKELLAVVYFMGYFHHYLLGAKTTVRTDHGSLQWLKQMKNPTDQVARWITRLEAYDWNIVHRPGRQHGNADAMSRRLCDGDCPQCEKIHRQTHCIFAEEEETCLTQRCYRLEALPLKKRRQWKRKEKELEILQQCHVKLSEPLLQKVTDSDETLRTLRQWTERPEWEVVSGCNPEIKFYWKMYGTWKFDGKGLLWYRWVHPNQAEQWKLVIPQELRIEILKAVHDTPTGGHLGEKRCLKTLQRIPVFWYGMRTDLKYHCRMCDMCFRCKPTTKRLRAPLVRYPVGAPMQRMAIDIAGPFHPSEQNNRYILVVMDYFTKWACLIPIPQHDAKTCAKALVEEVFCRIGIPAEIHSDQGREFVSETFEECCKMFRIEKTKTTPWRPQSDGMVERMNRTVGQMIRQYVAHNQKDWDAWLPLCSLAYNSSTHCSTGYTPFYLMFGRELRIPIELVLPPPDFEATEGIDDDEVDHVHFAARLRQTLKHVYAFARDNLNQAAVLQKRQYDKTSVDRKLEPGQGVWLYNPKRQKGRTPKLDIPWEGPYTVLRVRRGILVDIQLNRHTKPKVVHIDKLAPVRKPFDGSWIEHIPKKGRGAADSDLPMVPELFETAEAEARTKEDSVDDPSNIKEATPPTPEVTEPKVRKPRRMPVKPSRIPRGGRFRLPPPGRRPVTRSQTGKRSGPELDPG